MVKAIRQRIQETMALHRNIPFWSWNDRLEIDEIIQQAEAMKQAGMGGYFMHARGGLETPYLGKEWMEAVRTGVETAQRLEMEAWAYDEDGWPSGFAAGEVPRQGQDFQQKGLRSQWLKEDETPPDGTLGIYRLAEGRVVRVEKPAPGDLAVIVEINAYYIDALNRRAVTAFLDATHERYAQRFTSDFGKALKGFFTDEPQYANGCIPWSEYLREAYSGQYGVDPLEKLGALFLDGEGSSRFRWQYYKLAAELYREGFLGQMHAWCREHGCQLTGHVMAEDTLVSQLRCTGGAMACYEHMDIPGIDWLGRIVADSPVVPKQVGSVSAQLGRERVLSESFALCGWDVSFNELRWIAQWQFVNGVNVLCQHLSAYSLRGLRKRDYPASLHIQSSWFEQYRLFNEEFAWLGSALSQGEDAADILLLSPLDTVYGCYSPMNTAAAQEYSRGFAAASAHLSAQQLLHHYGDETLLARLGRVEEDRFVVGHCRYRAVILPGCVSIRENTRRLLMDFVRGGGQLYSLGEKPQLVEFEQSDMDELLAAMQPLESGGDWRHVLGDSDLLRVEQNGQASKAIELACRRLPDGNRLYFIINRTLEDQGTHALRLHGQYSLRPVGLRDADCPLPAYGEGNDTVWTLSFAPAQSYLLLCTPPMQEEVNVLQEEILKFPRTFQIEDQTPNGLTLDVCTYRLDDGAWQEPKAVILLQEELLRLQRPCRVDMRFSFSVRNLAAIRNVQLGMEKPAAFTFSINGQAFAFRDTGWYVDKAFRMCDVKRYLQEGKNILEMSARFSQRDEVYAVLFGENVHESEKNRLTLDTELESCYLFGDFSTELEGEVQRLPRRALRAQGSFRLAPPKTVVDIRDITTSGYWFFTGKLTVSRQFCVNKEANRRYILSADSLNMPVATVRVNGNDAGAFAFAPYRLDVTEWITDGENRIELCLYSGNRNLLGPHHRACGESHMVAPATFTDKPDWEGGSPPYWDDRYCFVEFGIALSSASSADS